MISASDHCADMLYASGFRAPDPFVLVEADGKRCLLLSDLEVDRGRHEARVDHVVSYSEFEKAIASGKKKTPSYAKVVAEFVRHYGGKRVAVSSDFSIGLFRALKKQNLRLRPAKGALFPEREFKTSEEIRKLSAALRVAESGLERAMEILKASTIRKDGKLQWSRRILTSEILRSEMDIAVIRAGGEARGDTIVACGDEACDPHARGAGPLLANSLIILDIFPRSLKSGYFGDITRTVVRGQASPEQRRLWEVCLAGQEKAFAELVPGAKGGVLQKGIRDFFAEQGYPTEQHEGRWRGFFHGLGHGLGLEIHEAPRIGATTLAAGQVVTVEPGIYWPGVGGVRHEDVVVMTNTGHRLLTKFPKALEI